MEQLFGINGLMFWTEREIRLRRQFEEHFAFTMEQILLAENPAWKFIQVEAPLLTPRTEINPNYTDEDVWVQENPIDECLEKEFYQWIKDTDVYDVVDCLSKCKSDTPELLEALLEYVIDLNERLNREGDKYESHRPWVEQVFALWLNCYNKNPASLVLRPETTPGSYTYACHLLNSHSGVKPPFVVWQTGKSFRREQDQVTKNMRLKEFYQQEFQCIYTADTMNDYHAAVLEPVRKMIDEMIGLPTRIVKSDRLPSYSEVTMDVEAHTESYVFNKENDKWMEMCSISRRTDFPQKARFQTKKKIVEKDLLVLEIAIGLDRCVYSFEQRSRS